MENKKQFIADLSVLLNRYCWSSGLRKLEYFSPGKTYREEVVITYYGDHTEVVNVNCDNDIAMLKDICKRGLKS